MLVDEKDFCVVFTWTSLQFLRAWWMDFKVSVERGERR